MPTTTMTGGIIASVPITLTQVELALEFPAEVPAGSPFSVMWSGPNVDRDNIQVGPVGGGYESWVYTKHGNPAELIAPAKPGDYEVRYVFQDRETILSKPIKVVEAPLSLSAPDSVAGGTTVEVMWEGPNGQSDNIQIGPIGGSYEDWVYTDRGNPAILIAPVVAGEYDHLPEAAFYMVGNMDEAIEKEQVPPGYTDSIKKYFDSMKKSDAKEDK